MIRLISSTSKEGEVGRKGFRFACMPGMAVIDAGNQGGRSLVVYEPSAGWRILETTQGGASTVPMGG